MEKLTRYSIIFIVLILFQILILNNVPAIGLISPYLYLAFILMLPVVTSQTLVLLLAFISGLLIDLSISSPGVHASACVMMAFVRPGLLKIFAPRIGYEKNNIPIVKYFGIFWTTKYVLTSIAIHHIVLYFCFTFSLEDFGFLFVKMILNIFLTVFIIILSEIFIFKE